MMVENGWRHTKGEQNNFQLCVRCFNCKSKSDEIYCKFGCFKEKKSTRPIIHVPQDFDCPEYDEV